METANTIAQQIGRRALFMLGAKDLMAIDDGNGLGFRIRGSRKANYIAIRYQAGADLYDIEFKKLGRAPKYKITDVAKFEGVYADMLHGLIESTTELYTSL